MRKLLLLSILILSLTQVMAATFQTTYAVTDGEVFRSGSQVVRRCITLTFGEPGGADFLNAVPYALATEFPAYCPGNNVNGDVKRGTFYVFTPKKDGTLTVGVLQNANKKLYVEEDGIPLPNYNGNSVDEKTKYQLSFTVRGGSTYKLYCSGSKLGFYGFTYSWEAEAAVSAFETAQEAVKNMKIGWNLSNSLDSHNGNFTGKSDDLITPEDWEACWGNGNTRPALLAMMKKAGFNAIRVPVTWFPHMAANGAVDKAWMKRVHEVVDYVVSQGMYCILNTHHDTEYRKWDDSEGKKAHLSADEDNYQANKEMFEFLWRQIANEFKDYDHRLIFEAYNEMTDIYGSWGCPDNGHGDAHIYGAYRTINNYAQSFVNAVRSTGGNNQGRNLVVNIYSGCTGPTEMDAVTLRSLLVPDDIIDNHIIFGVHCYAGTDNVSDIDFIYKIIRENITSRGIPSIISEWWSDTIHTDEYGYFVRRAKEEGVASFFWGGMSDGKNYRELPAFNNPEVTTAFLKDYYGNDYEPVLLTLDDYDYQYTTVHFDYLWAELSICDEVDLNEYQGIKIEVENPDGVALKVYGKSEEQVQYFEITSMTETIIFSPSELGDKLTGITLQNSKEGENTVKLIHTYLIGKDGSEQSIKPTSYYTFHGCTYAYTMPLKGDANRDGKVNAVDIVELVNYLEGHPSSSFDDSAADANGDKQVDSQDITAICNIILR